MGGAIAERLAHEGADVAVADMRDTLWQDTARAVTALGRRTLALSVDGTDTAQVGVTVQLVLKPPVWSCNKISDLANIEVDYCRKINHLLRFFPIGAVAPLGQHVNRYSSLGTRDIEPTWTEAVPITLSSATAGGARATWREIAGSH